MQHLTPYGSAAGAQLVDREGAKEVRKTFGPDAIEAMEHDRVGKAVQDAWVKHDVPQCGYCQSGQVMSATALLAMF